jgi:hypothetical protein
VSWKNVPAHLSGVLGGLRIDPSPTEKKAEAARARLAQADGGLALPRIRLIYWKPQEAGERANTLRALGYDMDERPIDGPAGIRELKGNPPDAVIIDLSARPSLGRDMALAIRQPKALRQVPLLFVEGDAEKVAQIRQVLPDEVYTTWRKIRGALAQALKQPREPGAAPSVFAGYSGTPLPKKLGIKAGSVVLLVNAPDDFERTLGALPDRAVVCDQARGRVDVALWFVTSRAELERQIQKKSQLGNDGGRLWIIWPKKASGIATDVSEPVVREIGLASGLVDYKVCAVDHVWSGLLFTRRAERGKPA